MQQSIFSISSLDEYQELHQFSLAQPEKFWADLAHQELEWFKPWTRVFDQSGNNFKWFVDGQINISHNCLDRHVNNSKAHQVAYIEIDESGHRQTITFAQLLGLVNQFAHVLLNLGVGQGDVVTIYMPLCIVQIAAMLACARVGAVHSVIFAGFSEVALSDRIKTSASNLVITTDIMTRKGKAIDLLHIARKAVSETSPTQLLIHKTVTGTKLRSNEHDLLRLAKTQPQNFDPVHQDSEDALFVLYTSGTTGKPKGIVHTTGGYNLFSHVTMKATFDIQPTDIYWCTADCGWITGHSYIVYGPLSVGVTSLIYNGSPLYPQPDRWWQLIEQEKVTKFYTAPTAIRTFMGLGESRLQHYDLSSLKIIGSVGEPLNPEAWYWYQQYVGLDQARVVDTWWQTETGGHMLVTLPHLPQKPGKPGLPFFGIDPAIVNQTGTIQKPNQKGLLVIKRPWPGAFRNCYQDIDTYNRYWQTLAPNYLTGDFAVKDSDGYFQVLGRSDDVVNISGHRIGTAEVENILISHKQITEAAVVGVPDQLKGTALVMYVVPTAIETETLDVGEIREYVLTNMGKHLYIKQIIAVESLPKTRSGKIMRRLLKAQYLGESLGDLSTLLD